MIHAKSMASFSLSNRSCFCFFKPAARENTVVLSRDIRANLFNLYDIFKQALQFSYIDSEIYKLEMWDGNV